MKIDTDHPTPDNIGKRKYPFDKMQPGDSIFFEGEFGGSRSKPATAARAYTFKRGKRFAIKTTNKGLRIYCIADKAGGLGDPLPYKRSGKYQFHKMQVSDSLKIPADEIKLARACYKAHATDTGKRFKETKAGDCVVVVRVS